MTRERACAFLIGVAMILAAGLALHVWATPDPPTAPAPCSVTTEPGDTCVVRLAPLPTAAPSRKD